MDRVIGHFLNDNREWVIGVCVLFFVLFCIYISHLIKRKPTKNNTISQASPVSKSFELSEYQIRLNENKEMFRSWGLSTKIVNTLSRADLSPDQVKTMTFEELKAIRGMGEIGARRILEATQNLPYQVIERKPFIIPNELPVLNNLPLTESDLPKGMKLNVWYSQFWKCDHMLAGCLARAGVYPAELILMTEAQLEELFGSIYLNVWNHDTSKTIQESQMRKRKLNEIIRLTKEADNR